MSAKASSGSLLPPSQFGYFTTPMSFPPVTRFSSSSSSSTLACLLALLRSSGFARFGFCSDSFSLMPVSCFRLDERKQQYHRVPAVTLVAGWGLSQSSSFRFSVFIFYSGTMFVCSTRNPLQLVFVEFNICLLAGLAQVVGLRTPRFSLGLLLAHACLLLQVGRT